MALHKVGKCGICGTDGIRLTKEGYITPHKGCGATGAPVLERAYRDREAVNHPSHYGGDTVYEVIKVLKAWGLDRDAYLWNTVKYIARAGKKDSTKTAQDLKKARFYLNERIKELDPSDRGKD